MGKSEKPLAGQSDYTEVLPLAEEQAEIIKHRHVDAKVQVSRTTHTRQEELSSELMREEVHIQHRPLNIRLADDDDIPQMRQEGDVLIIPVIEEEVEIIRRKVLKEEIHILKNTTSEKYTQDVTLRRQEVTITKDEN